LQIDILTVIVGVVVSVNVFVKQNVIFIVNVA